MVTKKSDPIGIILIGAGNRGSGIFGRYALDNSHQAKFVAVVEPDTVRRENFAQIHKIPNSLACENVAQLKLPDKKIADAVVIATHESERITPMKWAVEKGYHILTEKPLGCTIEQVIELTDLAAKSQKFFVVCHQMRYAPAYEIIKKLITSGQYGRIISIQHSENLSWHHMAHSFVRGPFNNTCLTPMIISKSCHDMDILCYFINSRPKKVSSFGSLSYFKPENAPSGAAKFCLDNCPAYSSCPYHVLKIYFNGETDPAYIRQMGVIRDKQHLFDVLKTNRFGRCVFQCDNNVVDHQVVQVEFENEVTASFEMVGHNYLERRMTKLAMTNGEIQFDSSEGTVKAYTFEPLKEDLIRPSGVAGTHLGGDQKIMDSFVQAIRTGEKESLLTSVRMSLSSHLMGFAAEEARVSGRIIDLSEFEQSARLR